MATQTTPLPQRPEAEAEEPVDYPAEEIPLWVLVADLLTLGLLAALFWYLLEVFLSTRGNPRGASLPR